MYRVPTEVQIIPLNIMCAGCDRNEKTSAMEAFFVAILQLINSCHSNLTQRMKERPQFCQMFATFSFYMNRYQLQRVVNYKKKLKLWGYYSEIFK